MTRALMLSQVPRTALPVEPEFNRQSVRAVLRGQAEGVELVVRRAEGGIARPPEESALGDGGAR